MSNKDIFEELLTIWRNLTKEEQNEARSTITFAKYDHDTFVTTSVFSVDCLIFVRSGGIREYAISHQGREITLNRFSAGDTFFYTRALFEQKNQCIVGTIQKGTELYLIPFTTVYKVMVHHEELFHAFINTAENLYINTANTLTSGVFDSVRSRLAHYILQESLRVGKGIVLATHEELANELGSTRVVISRELEHLAKAGAIDIHRGRITIKDREKLQEVAES